jgi:hypothetical protein
LFSLAQAHHDWDRHNTDVYRPDFSPLHATAIRSINAEGVAL